MIYIDFEKRISLKYEVRCSKHKASRTYTQFQLNEILLNEVFNQEHFFLLMYANIRIIFFSFIR